MLAIVADVRSRLQAAWKAVPLAFRIYFVAYMAIVLLICFWVPLNDFDSSTSYIVRIKLEEFGNLRDTATLEIQYLFPKFYDYLHTPFLALGYFVTLPSLIVFGLLLFIYAIVLKPREFALALACCLAVSAVTATIATAKNDLPLGIFAVIAWGAVCLLPNSPLYLSLSLLSLALLMGTKWHGAFLVIALAPVLIWRLRQQNITKSLLWFVAFSPLLFWVSSADVYLANWWYDGSLTPTPDFLKRSPISLVAYFENCRNFLALTFFDAFDPLFLLLDVHCQTDLWSWLQNVTGGSKQLRYAAYANTHFMTFGPLLLPILGFCIAAMFRRSLPWQVRVAAIVALVYTALTLLAARHTSWTVRYYLPTFLLGMVPFVTLIRQLNWDRPVLIAMMLLAVPSSLQVLLMQSERRLVTFNEHWPDGQAHCRESILNAGLDRDSLMFVLWTGYEDPYRKFSEAVPASASLTIINNAQGNDAPYLFPFVKDRDGSAATEVISTRLGKSWDPDQSLPTDFVLTHRTWLDDPRYTKVFDYHGINELVLYRRTSEAGPNENAVTELRSAQASRP